MIDRNIVEHPPKKVTAEDQKEAIRITAHRKTLYYFLVFIAGKRLNQTFETLGNFHDKWLCTKCKYSNQSANGAKYNSQGQARSASPLVKKNNQYSSPERA